MLLHDVSLFYWLGIFYDYPRQSGIEVSCSATLAANRP
jgi:hypothetical protein